MTSGITRKMSKLKGPRIEMDTLVMFPEKLYEVANDDYIIHWLHGGKVIVVDIQLLEDEVMEAYPGFLQKSTFMNLRRLFREYGFYWETNEDGYMEFTHPSFIRGHPELLENVNTRRRACKGALSRRKKNNCRGELLKTIQDKATIEPQFSPRRRYQYHRQSIKHDNEKQIIYVPQQIYAIKGPPKVPSSARHSNLTKVHKEPDPMFSYYFGGHQNLSQTEANQSGHQYSSPSHSNQSSQAKDFSYLIDTLDKNEDMSFTEKDPAPLCTAVKMEDGSPNSQLTRQLLNLLHDRSASRSNSGISINNQHDMVVEKPTPAVLNSNALLMSSFPSSVTEVNNRLRESDQARNPSLASFISSSWPCESCKTALFGILTGLCGEEDEVSYERGDNNQWPSQPKMESDIPVGLPLSLFNYGQPGSVEHCKSPIEQVDHNNDFKQSQFEEVDTYSQSDYSQHNSEYFEEEHDCEISNVYLISEG